MEPTIMMEEISNPATTTIQMTEEIKPIDVPIDITHIKSVKCYNFGKCMKACCRIDKHLTDKKDKEYTSLVVTEGTVCTSSICSASFACLGGFVACLDSCYVSSSATTAPAQMFTCLKCWQTSLIVSASCFAVTLLSLGFCGSIYFCNKCGARCTNKLGCHSFSKGFDE